ncbi:MAG: hypothetical protein ABI611_19065 [Solirubrobacteraceae bacterium]
MALGLAWVALAAGCGSAGDAKPPSGDASALAHAERSLQAELEAAAAHLGMSPGAGERVAPARCGDRPAGDVTSGYRLRMKLGPGDAETLLRSAEGFWRERGRAVRVVGSKSRFPAVFATADPGWTFSLQLFPERGEALLSGGTPCLPDPKA